MVNEPVNRRDRHHGITKNGMPLTKRLISRDHDAFALIAIGNEFKEDGGFGLRLLDIAKVINEQEVEAVELFEGRLKLEMELLLLQVLHQGGGTKELDALACFDRRAGHTRRQMGLSNAGWPEKQTVLSLVNPLGFSRKFLNGDGVNQGQVCPVEVGNRFGVWELCLGEGSLEA